MNDDKDEDDAAPLVLPAKTERGGRAAERPTTRPTSRPSRSASRPVGQSLPSRRRRHARADRRAADAGSRRRSRASTGSRGRRRTTCGRPRSYDRSRPAAAHAAAPHRLPPRPQPHAADPHRHRRCPPVGTPTRPAASSCATGTAARGPSTCRAPASSSPTPPSPDATVTSHRRSPRSKPDRRRRSLASIRMRATSIGHAGILIDTVDGSILCDPWFLPAFFGSWFVFPRNDQLSAELMERIEHPTYLYISHLHADHLDEPWLTDHVDRDDDGAAARLPDARARAQDPLARLRQLRAHHRRRGARTRSAICASPSTSRRASPTGPAATRRSSSATAPPGSSTRTTAAPTTSTRCAPTVRSICTGCSTAGRSGTRWSTTSHRERMRELVDAKVDSQFARAMRYVEAIDATRRRAERRTARVPRSRSCSAST